jgi:hypothetical protein
MVLIFQGCKKEQLEQSANFNAQNKSSLRTGTDFTEVRFENEVLCFPNNDYVVRVLNNLDADIEKWNTDFFNNYRHLPEDSLNLIAEQQNFNDEQPLLDFEEYFRIKSLRQIISEKEQLWLLTDGEKIENDPDNHFITDNTVRTILNEYAEVKIGNSYFKFVEHGYYEVTDGNFETLKLLRDTNVNNLTNLVNVVFHKSLSGEGCNSNKRKEDYKTVGSKRIKWVVSHWTYPWGRYAIAKTDNYEKRNNKWKKYSTYTEARVYGYISDVNQDGTADCTKQLQFNTSSGPAETGTVKELKQKITVSTKTKSGWINGYHYGAGGISHTSTLTW